VTATEVIIRHAGRDDLASVAKLAAKLVRLHHAFDPRRFFLEEPVERGYEWWLGRELENNDAIVMIATVADVLRGYVYATIEKRDWNLLLDRYAGLHDVYVDESARSSGVGEKLLRSLIDEVKRRGSPRIVLMSAVQNESAQRLFAKVGFRATMIEMTCEVEES
jgi:ribosomal protein S18 acetylase RimI-like enzyme